MEKGVCPCCNGTLKVNGRDCRNCGGQYMYGPVTGEVRLNKEGVPCTHSYESKEIGRCYTRYTCRHCGDQHSIDSGD